MWALSILLLKEMFKINDSPDIIGGSRISSLPLRNIILAHPVRLEYVEQHGYIIYLGWINDSPVSSLLTCRPGYSLRLNYPNLLQDSLVKSPLKSNFINHHSGLLNDNFQSPLQLGFQGSDSDCQTLPPLLPQLLWLLPN